MKLSPNPRILIAGSVNSSRRTLLKLVEHRMNVVAVMSLTSDGNGRVSGYQDLRSIAELNGIEHKYFKRINEAEAIDFVRAMKPDLLFVIGLSQMVKPELLSIATTANIGFHPTKLPRGRGRGAVAWLILGKAPGAATFFLMDEHMDAGPILVQQEFEVENNDYASDVIEKIMKAIDLALDHILPKIREGRKIELLEQDETQATYLGRRTPGDGLINWNNSARDIFALIRAAASPLPGAYSYFRDKKVIVRRAALANPDVRHYGVPGRVLQSDPDKGLLVQTGEGLLWLVDLEGDTTDHIRIGSDLGINFEKRMLSLQEEINQLKLLIDE